MSGILKRKRKVTNSNQPERIGEVSYAEGEEQQQNTEVLNNIHRQSAEKQHNRLHENTQNKLRSNEDETVGGESVDETLPRPYEFLLYANPPLHTIFFPHFKIKSITFVLSIIYIICFVILLAYSYTKPIQNKLTWNCSIFELQNKYFPRIRYGYEFWRVPISFFFHSNIAHFVLDFIGLQIYGYFVEWYYGKVKYAVVLVFSGLLAHFFSCIALPTSISTVPSTFLYSIIVLKLFFLYDYRDYKPLLTRRIFIYVLIVLIAGVNLIPIFVSNNVDFTTHISGIFVGIFMGFFCQLQKQEEPTKVKLALKFVSILLIGIFIIVSIALLYGLPDNNSQYYALNQNIKSKCAEVD